MPKHKRLKPAGLLSPHPSWRCVFMLRDRSHYVKGCGAGRNVRKLLADAHAEKPLALLKRAAEADFFQEKKNRDRLTTDKDLAPLRDREDFQEFLKSLDEE